MRVVPFLLGACLVAGCRHAESVSEFDKDRLYRLDLLQPREYHTSQDTVLRIMGPAEAVSADGQAWAYHWRTYTTAGPLLRVHWPWPRDSRAYGDTGELRLHVLLLEFEASGLLVRKHAWSAIESSNLPATRKILEEWHAQARLPDGTAPEGPRGR